MVTEMPGRHLGDDAILKSQFMGLFVDPGRSLRLRDSILQVGILVAIDLKAVDRHIGNAIFYECRV